MNPFGPLLRFELVRIAQKQRMTLARTLYAIGLGAIIVVVYYTATDGLQNKPEARDQAHGAQNLFFGLFGAQAVLACALAPRWIADAVTTEKEKQTLPFLLLTDLSSREIILDKLAARLAQILLFLLTGLPLLVFLQLFGGIEPILPIVCYAVLFVTLVSLGCVSILCSVYGRTTKAATQLFGRIIGLYVGLLVVGANVLRAWPAVGWFPGTAANQAWLCVHDLYDFINLGNPLGAVEQVIGNLRIGGGFTDVLWPAARNYMLFHLGVAVVCGTWAVRRLRPVAATHGEGPPLPSKQVWLKPRQRPPVGDWPVYWKALHFDFRQSRSKAGLVFARLIFLFSFAPAAVPLIILGLQGGFLGADTIMMFICRFLVTLALSGMLVIIASNASATIGRERNKRTLDELLLTDLTTDEILTQKWWASAVVIRWGLVWVAIHWLLGVLTGGLHVLAIPVLILEWVVYATFAASLGMYFTARMYTAQGANGGTGLVGFGLGALPLMIGLLLRLVSDLPLIYLFPIFVSPPAVLGAGAFAVFDLDPKKSFLPSILAPVCAGTLVSMVIYVVLARKLWRGARWWFPRMVGRR